MPESDSHPLPLNAEALIDTLKALRSAVAATAEVALARGESIRADRCRAADVALAEVGACIERLAKTAQEAPTLFGRNVGDGLETEREEARQALSLLRGILANHVLSSSTPVEGVTQLSFAGSHLAHEEEMDLIHSVLGGPTLDEASPAYLEATGQGSVAIGLLRKLLRDGWATRSNLGLRASTVFECYPLDAFEEALVDALKGT